MISTKQLLSSVLVVLSILYPFIVFFGLKYVEPTLIALILVVLLVVRALMIRKASSSFNQAYWFVGVAILILIVTTVSGKDIGLKLYPVLVNTVLMIVFALSLFKGQTVIERIARIADPDLPEEGVKYTRNVTKVWSAFFLINGAISTYTVFLEEKYWTLYNGLIAYLLIGALMIVELLCRKIVMSRHRQAG